MAKVTRAIYSERQLQQVVDDFWFNHFNVFAGKGEDRYYLTSYERDVIQPHALAKLKHRRTLRCRGEQILEFSERVRLDDVALVRSEVVAVLAFSRKHVEVVEPEIVHHLLKLSLAVNRARHLGHGEFRSDARRPLAVVRNCARHAVRVASAKRFTATRSSRRLVQLHGWFFHRSRRVLRCGLRNGLAARRGTLRVLRFAGLRLLL